MLAPARGAIGPEEQSGSPSTTMSLPPILPPPAPVAIPAAAPRAQPRKPAAPRKAAPPPPAEEKPARKPRGAPPERPGPFPSSWPCASLQRQQPRRPAPAPPQPRGRSCESLCAAAGPEAAAAGEAALRFSLSLPPEAALVLQRRSLEKQRGRPSPSAGTERLLPGSRSKAAPAAAGGSARRGARAGPGSGPGDLRALLKISLLNERHRYDDVEYEEEAAPGAAADEGLVRKCTEWLRGVESAAGRDRADKLETLPHLGAL